MTRLEAGQAGNIAPQRIGGDGLKQTLDFGVVGAERNLWWLEIINDGNGAFLVTCNRGGKNGKKHHCGEFESGLQKRGWHASLAYETNPKLPYAYNRESFSGTRLYGSFICKKLSQSVVGFASKEQFVL